MDDSTVAEAIGGAGTQWLRHRRAAALSIALGTSVLPLWSAPKSDCGNAVDAVLKAYQVRPVLSIVLYSAPYSICAATQRAALVYARVLRSPAQRSAAAAILSVGIGVLGIGVLGIGVLTQGWLVRTEYSPRDG